MPDYLNIARRALDATQGTQHRERLEEVLNGLAVELWTDGAGYLFIVADEEDLRNLNTPRGTVYTAAEVRRVVQIGDPAIIREIHQWKRTLNGRIR